MRSSVDGLLQDLAALRALAESIGLVNAAIEGHQDPRVLQYRVLRRQFDHVAFVVGIYAAFEQFAEDIVASYSRAISRVASYESLPERMTRKHLGKSAEMIMRGEAGRGRHRELSTLSLVRNLMACLSDAPGYELNHAAITAHDRNLRHAELREFLNVVDISLDRAKYADPLSEWRRAAEEAGGDALADVSPPPTPERLGELVEARIDYIVERRNEVAHRGGRPTELFNPGQMVGWIAFIEALARSTFVLFAEAYLERVYVKSGKCRELGLVKGPFGKKKVRVVGKPPGRLYVGQPVFSLAPDSFVARWGRIQELQVAGLAVAAVEEADTCALVGIRTDFACPERAPLYALQEDDDLIWPAA